MVLFLVLILVGPFPGFHHPFHYRRKRNATPLKKKTGRNCRFFGWSSATCEGLDCPIVHNKAASKDQTGSNLQLYHQWLSQSQDRFRAWKTEIGSVDGILSIQWQELDSLYCFAQLCSAFIIWIRIKFFRFMYVFGLGFVFFSEKKKCLKTFGLIFLHSLTSLFLPAFGIHATRTGSQRNKHFHDLWLG